MENSTNEQISHIKSVIETLLFVSDKPVILEDIKKVLQTVSAAEIKNVMTILIDEYAQRNGGMAILEIAGGYQMLTNSVYASYVRSFYKTKHKEKLSKPALEALAIVAYKQPVSRGDIELIRGVNSDGVVVHLLEKELIKAVGRRDVPGKPFLYGTTKQFLEYFGLKSLENLPKLEEFPKLQPKIDGDDSSDTLLPVEDQTTTTTVAQEQTQDNISSQPAAAHAASTPLSESADTQELQETAEGQN